MHRRPMNALFLMISMITLFCTSPAFAAEGDVAVGQVVSQENAQEMRLQMAKMAKGLGLTVMDEQGNEVAPASTDMAAVADKALEMADVRLDQLFEGTSALVGQLSDVMKNVAPEIWRIMIVQQYVKAIADLVLPACLFLVSLGFFLSFMKWWKPDFEKISYEDKGLVIAFHFCFAKLIPIVLMVIFSILTVCALNSSIKYAINPEYYAVKDIMIMISNPESLTEGAAGTQTP